MNYAQVFNAQTENPLAERGFQSRKGLFLYLLFNRISKLSAGAMQVITLTRLVTTGNERGSRGRRREREKVTYKIIDYYVMNMSR